jgi:CheY-like chemotaxis protein
MPELKRILVAEDHQTTRCGWTELIASSGFALKAADDGRHATELIDSYKPHALPLHLKMPFRDGSDITDIHDRGLPVAAIVICAPKKLATRLAPRKIAGKVKGGTKPKGIGTS